MSAFVYRGEGAGLRSVKSIQLALERLLATADGPLRPLLRPQTLVSSAQVCARDCPPRL